MAKAVSITLGGLMTVALMVSALWVWRLAPDLAYQHADHAYAARLGIRSLAIALGAGAQVVLFTFVIARVYEPRLLDRVLSVATGVTSFAALGTAIVLALSSR